jgi:hypothetical protein
MRCSWEVRNKLYRFLAQIDVGGLPYAQVEQMIDLFASEVAPAVRRATAKK